MFLELYDNLTKSKKILDLLKNVIKMYVCGPTVYDYCHLGHARVFIFFDALRRFLLKNNPNVIFVQNVTDVADKIKNRALDLNISEEDIINKYMNYFFEDCELLNILKPNFQPKASEYIGKMCEYISKMLENGSAYITSSGIYLDTSKINYWQFEKRDVIEQEYLDDQKKAAQHFALWKFTNKHNYQSPWGQGIPGWHIECTVMSNEILGNRFDIHGGGDDLRFPHHENEIAQSEALFGHGPADFWVHSGMVNIDGEKMSKSLQNFWFIKDMIHNTFEADAFRYLILSHNYHGTIEITMEKIIQTKETIKNIRKYYFKNCLNDYTNIDFDVNIFKPLYLDFDTPTLLSTIGEYITKNDHKSVYLILNTLGFKMENLCKLKIFEIDELIEQRTTAKLSRNFTLADEIRDILNKNFIEIEDSVNGVSWHYT